MHLQGQCKPWLTSKRTLARAKCLKALAYFWHAVWRPLTLTRDDGRRPDLNATCPSMARAYERFVEIAPPEASRPCFWGGECFGRFRPSWVIDF